MTDAPGLDETSTGLSRRDALLAGGALALGAGGALGARAIADAATNPAASATSSPPPIPAAGAHQAGIARPSTPQQHGLVAVYDVPGTDAAASASMPARLAAATDAIAAITGTAEPTTASLDGAADLTVTVGVGPRLVSAANPTLPGASAMPPFAGDEAIAPERVGGDLLISAYATDPSVLSAAVAHVAAAMGDLEPRWRQFGFRAPGEGTVARNPLGFHDGVIVPRGKDELDDSVWIGDGPAAGGTVCVIRQLRLDVAGFAAEPQARQEEVIGRRKSDGTPLSGGGPLAEVDLRAKHPDGELVTPLRSHARAAHPSFTGSGLMLRRGYAYANGAAAGAATDDQGLLFICFQRELDDFVRTQQRLDEVDDLMPYATPVSSASFLILPGFTVAKPLGSGIFG